MYLREVSYLSRLRTPLRCPKIKGKAEHGLTEHMKLGTAITGGDNPHVLHLIASEGASAALIDVTSSVIPRLSLLAFKEVAKSIGMQLVTVVDVSDVGNLLWLLRNQFTCISLQGTERLDDSLREALQLHVRYTRATNPDLKIAVRLAKGERPSRPTPFKADMIHADLRGGDLDADVLSDAKGTGLEIIAQISDTADARDVAAHRFATVFYSSDLELFVTGSRNLIKGARARAA